MGSLFKKTATRPLPPGAEIITRQGERLARWRDGKGKMRTAPVTMGQSGADRIRDESATYVARYRDGNGLVIEFSTGCRDKTAAQNVLADLERQAEKVRAGLLTPAEARVSEHLARPIAEHVEDFLNSLEARGATSKYVRESRRILKRIFDECCFRTLADLDASAVEAWLNQRRLRDASARTRNTDRGTLFSFGNWCTSRNVKRIISNPFEDLPRADEKADPRRKRRSMTEAELIHLLDVARRRPLLDAQTVRRGKKKGQAVATLKPETRDSLESLGMERALIYKTMVLSGLRKGELASLTVAQLRLEGSVPHVELDAEDEKNRQGNSVMIRADLADDLKHWLERKLAALQAEALRRGEPIPARLPGNVRVFDIPDGLVRILDRDLRAAGIPKRDERGRTLDVHALRTTFGTLLSRGGVPLRTAQATMRHSTPTLTANTYTDPKLLDVAGALDALPSLPLDRGPNANSEQARAIATGTYGNGAVALPDDKRCKTVVNPDKTEVEPPHFLRDGSGLT